MKKRVLVIGPLSSGHIQKWVAPLTENFEFIFFTLHKSKKDKILQGLPVISFPRVTGTRLDFMLAIPFLIYVIFKYSPNLLHVHFLSSYGLMAGISGFKSIPKILSTWGTDVNGKAQKNRLLRFLIKKIASRYSVVNAPATHIKEKMITLGFEAEKIFVFQYGIHLSSYPKKDMTATEMQKVSFLSIRNWDDLYNIEILLTAYSIFSQNNKLKTELKIIGKGDIKAKEAIERLVGKLNFGISEVTIIGFVDTSYMKELIFASDFVVSIPSIDGTPLSVLESIYIGAIPIVSDIDANKEWFCEETAIFVDHTQVTSVENGFKRAVELKCNADLESMITINRNKVIEKACYITNTNRLKILYNSLLTKIKV